MKKLAIVLLMAFMPIIVFAQAAGGQVKRPVKKQQESTNMPPKKKVTVKTKNEQIPPKEKVRVENLPSQKMSSDQIIKQLIKNMVYVEGGTFTMGATYEQGSIVHKDERPAHKVTVSSFYICKYEVTQEEWETIMGSNPSKFKGARHPVENISWNECQDFIHKLNILTGKQFRLPTEAEWEYAARGGIKKIDYNYSGSDDLDIVAWYNVNSGSITHDVGQKKPNKLGLYDMSGNVEEWCMDWYGIYGSDNQMNPFGPSSGYNRVDRGGSWNSDSKDCRVSYRSYGTPSYKGNTLGLRLAL